MKKINKILLSLGCLSITTIPMITMVSCGDKPDPSHEITYDGPESFTIDAKQGETIQLIFSLNFTPEKELIPTIEKTEATEGVKLNQLKVVDKDPSKYTYELSFKKESEWVENDYIKFNLNFVKYDQSFSFEIHHQNKTVNLNIYDDTTQNYPLLRSELTHFNTTTTYAFLVDYSLWNADWSTKKPYFKFFGENSSFMSISALTALNVYYKTQPEDENWTLTENWSVSKELGILILEEPFKNWITKTYILKIEVKFDKEGDFFFVGN